MKWVDRYPALVLLTIETAILSFCLADGQLALAGISALIVGFAWVMRKRTPPVNLPKFAVTLLVLAAVIHAFLSRTTAPNSGQAVVSHLGEFLVYIQLIKLFDRRTFRDETHVLTLSVFVVIASILTSNELLVGALLLMYAVMATACAMLAQIRQGRMQTEEDAQGAISAAAPPGVAARRRGADVQFGLLSVGATAVIGLIATVLFVFTPRGVGENTLGTFGRARQMTIGYTDTVKLGQSGLLSESPTPVLEMRVTDIEGRNVGSPGRIFYLRGATRSVYRSEVRTWESRSSSGGGQRQAEPRDEEPLATKGFSPNSLLIQHIATRRNPAQGSPIFGVWRPVLISFEHPAKFVPDDRDGTLRLPRQDRPGALRYTVTSSPTFSETFKEPEDEPRVREEHVFAPPELDAVIAEALAARGVTLPLDVSEPFAIRTACAAIRDHLQQNYEYTLDLPAPPGNVDPVIWFLTTSKIGHCEYYASAMTLMLQRIGVPARLVTGYVAGEYNNANGDYIVRESNAHAWVEAYLGEGRWQMYDPTPAGVVESLHRPNHTLMGRLRHWYEMLEFNWSSAVVGFDKTRQSEFLSPYSEGDRVFERAGRWFSEAGERLLDKIGARRLGIDLPPAIVPLFPVIVLLSIAIYQAGGWMVRRVTKSVRGARRRDPEVVAVMRQARFYQRALRVLDRAGLAKPRSRAPLTHASAIETAGNESAEAAEALRTVADAFYRVRFGRHALTPSELRAAESAVSAMEASLRRRRG